MSVQIAKDVTTLETEQQMFDHVLASIRKQGCASVDGDTCLYLSSSGLKCSAGHLFTDDELETIMDSGYGDEDALCVVEEMVDRLQYHMEFIYGLQLVHDHSSDANLDDNDGFIESFEISMKEFAQDNNLTYTPS